ncbi:erythrocyte membrane protein 1 (PfEMP1), truncated, putative [Plasmodium gaboni]|uniref:Erythrocyte membrane protein 1 (PfEMP1), truncated, putative n=1 Tax=Plasmodium gaboni TaxID=647221 RepID=A0ABY0KW69_9APIC|nr:erythrocyte membrane protein 1 (PfEMP1), truncated, putative [Plasmodium gaboni]
MFYTYSDFHDLITGKDIGNDSGKNVSENVKKILDKETDTKYNGKSDEEKRKKFWEDNKEDIWKGMLCALTHASGSNKDTLNSKYGHDTVKFDGTTTGVDLTTFSSRPQFLRWFTEWYDDYCYRKKTLYKDVETACKKVGDPNFKCDDTECKNKCKEYENFMKGKQKEWEKQEKFYKQQQSGNTNEYSGTDAKDYLKNKFIITCGAQPSGATPQSGDDVVKNINALTTSSSLYYDADQYCGCKKYIEDNDYINISGKDNCTGLQNEVNTQSGIKWDSAEGGYSYLKDKGLSSDVYIPPRKQKLCFRGIDGKYDNVDNGVNNKDKLREQLLKVSAIEGYNLGEYYKEKNKNSDDTKYAYDVLPCNAMKYSFLDLRNIILGHDMTEPELFETEKNLNKIFKNGNKLNNTDRKSWWEKNQQCVWDAMKCGYRKGRDEGSSGNPKPSDKDLTNCNDIPNGSPNGQKIFCVKQKKELQKLQKHCSFHECKDASSKQKSQCLNACGNYKNFINKWKPQYRRQNIMYEGLREKISLKKDIAAPEFFTDNFKDECLYFENKNSTTIDELFPYPPKDYVDKCKCTNTPPLKTVPATRPKRARQLPPQPPKDDELNKCPFDNSDLDDWKNTLLKDPHNKNKGVLIPPRRRQLCIGELKNLGGRSKDKEKLKQYLLRDAYNEAKQLSGYYGNNHKKMLEAMKYSFADYGNIVKGNDMVNDLELAKKQLSSIFQPNGNASQTDNRKEWWETNKKKVWNVMMCHYNGNDKEKHCEDYEKIDKEDQFLRWLEEWSQLFCYEKKNEAKKVVDECLQKLQNEKYTKIDEIQDQTCNDMLQKYKKWYIDRNTQWKGLKDAYEKYKETNKGSSGNSQQLPDGADDYVKTKCKDCDCNYKDLDKIFKKKDDDTKLLSELIKTAKNDSTDPINLLDAIKNLFQRIKIFAPIAVKNVIRDPETLAQQILEKAVDGAFKVAAKTKNIVEKVQQQIQEEKEKNSQPTPPPQLPPVEPSPPAAPSTPGSRSTNPLSPSGGTSQTC